MQQDGQNGRKTQNGHERCAIVSFCSYARYKRKRDGEANTGQQNGHRKLPNIFYWIASHEAKNEKCQSIEQQKQQNIV